MMQELLPMSTVKLLEIYFHLFELKHLLTNLNHPHLLLLLAPFSFSSLSLELSELESQALTWVLIVMVQVQLIPLPNFPTTLEQQLLLPLSRIYDLRLRFLLMAHFSLLTTLPE